MDILTLQQASPLMTSGVKPAAVDANAELRAVAQDFEAMMLEQMLKSMRDASEVLAEDGMFNSREQQFWQEFQDSQLAMALSRTQGLGLADVIIDQVQRIQE